MEDLAHLSGATVRTIRSYADRGLLPRPERRGRANLYGDAHLLRLRQIAELLDRGYTLASIRELLEAWDSGRGLSGVLGLAAEVAGPWSDEEPQRLTRRDLNALFGGTPDEAAVREAVRLGVLVPAPGEAGEDVYVAPSPQELAVAAELHAAGVPLSAVAGHLRELRTQVEHIAERFLTFADRHVFADYLAGSGPPTDAEAAEVAGLVRRLRPLARQAVDAELARAMQVLSARTLRAHLRTTTGQPDAGGPPMAGFAGTGAAESSGRPEADAPPAAREPQEREPQDRHPPQDGRTTPVHLPAATVARVRDMVGEGNVAAFVAAATEREAAARMMDDLAHRRRR
ncbi:MerR family transcriptional regulator [Streptomyces sp. RKND-216]|uniref:MerR family transcriptional regulator n=1 Tax=Streptomyces sp. RKND-216 TaxID=2562581 RepID=UPI00109DD476|nr:MerR family transcriptional regulator [Streptomyces sp. RKND-216]THA27693.1 MerR family transcriptional regulator [Streptomyces sp. RKND-216]